MSESVTAEKASAVLQLGSLSEAILADIVSTLNAAALIDQVILSALKNSYPSLRFTLCYEQEMGSSDAYIESTMFNLYLVSHSLSGCSSLTFDLTASSGLVIALHDE